MHLRQVRHGRLQGRCQKHAPVGVVPRFRLRGDEVFLLTERADENDRPFADLLAERLIPAHDLTLTLLRDRDRQAHVAEELAVRAAETRAAVLHAPALDLIQRKLRDDHRRVGTLVCEPTLP